LIAKICRSRWRNWKRSFACDSSRWTALKSVQDPSLPAPFVPASVFTGARSAPYWSATTSADNPTFAWFVNFGSGGVGNSNKSSAHHVWCVRGGMHTDQY
jgi:hypothetical protein